jgi:hypothetical protein
MTVTEPPTAPIPDVSDADDEPEFRPRPRRRAHPLTFVLGGLVIVAAGFVGGVLLQKHEDSGARANASNTAASRFSGRGGSGTTGGPSSGRGGFNGFGGGGAGGSGAGGGSVVGTVKLIDGTNIYVTDPNGNVIKVTTTPASSITKTTPTSTKNIAPGDTLVVRGASSSDGSMVAATSVTDAGVGAANGPASASGTNG